MLTNAFSKTNRLFTLMLILLILLFGIALALFALTAFAAYEVEQDFIAEREQFEQRLDTWNAQAIDRYTVDYTNCNHLFCCQNALMDVEDGIKTLDPDCDSSSFGNYTSRTQDELFAWLRSYYINGVNFHRLEVDYHPELGYITALYFVGFNGAQPVELRYTDLQVR